MPKPGSETLEEIAALLVQTNAKLDTIIAAGGSPLDQDILNELTHLRFMFHSRQWETGAPLVNPFPAFPDRGDPVP